MLDENTPKPIQADMDRIIAAVRRMRAQQEKVTPWKDVPAFGRMLNRLMPHSFLNSADRAYIHRALNHFLDAEARKAPAAPPQEFGFLMKARVGRNADRVRLELEVNMREHERERLARRDTYERELECRAMKQAHRRGRIR